MTWRKEMDWARKPVFTLTSVRECPAGQISEKKIVLSLSTNDGWPCFLLFELTETFVCDQKQVPDFKFRGDNN